MRAPFLLLCLLALPVQAESLYKCVDASTREVTYSNFPCSKFPGMKETKTIQADPGPPVPATPKPAARKKAAAKPEAEEDKKAPQDKAEAKRVLKAERAEKSKCDRISEQISETMDRMDAARHKGYTAKQESEWNDKIKALNAKKNRMNCF